MKHISILWDDADILVVNKPANLVCHPAGEYQGDSLISRIHTIYSNNNIRFIHRLDKETSGVLVLGKNEHAIASLSNQWEKKSVKKVYIALVHGIIQESGIWNAYIAPDYRSNSLLHNKMHEDSNGKHARTEYKVLMTGENFTLLSLHPFTGRKHQLRLQCFLAGHAIIGDALYENAGIRFLWEKLLHRPAFASSNKQNLLLHAWSISFGHPSTHSRITIETPIPKRFYHWGINDSLSPYAVDSFSITKIN